jgi:hypothetical protein
VAVVDGAYDGVVVSGSTTNTMTITDPTAAWNGEYYAIVTDSTAECTTQTDPVDVEVPDVCALAITTQPVSQELEVGEDLELTVTSSGSVGTVTYQWYLDGVALTNGASGDSTISGVTTASLTIENVTASLDGSYTVQIIDDAFADCSVVSNTATVTISAPATPPEDTLFVWYKADAQPYADGVLALPIIDSSGNGVDIINSGNPPPNEEPYLETNIKNSLPALLWNAANTVDTGAVPGGVLPIFTGFTLAVVFNRTFYDASGPTVPVFIINGGVSTQAVLRSTTHADNTNTLRATGITSFAEVDVPVNTWQVVTFTFDFVEGIPRIRSNDLTDEGTADPGVITADFLTMQYTDVNYFAEALLYYEKLSESDLTRLRAYLAAKWDIHPLARASLCHPLTDSL